MAQYKVIINVSDEDFYRYLLKETIAEAEKYSKKEFTEDELKRGLHYSFTKRNKNEVEIQTLPLNKNKELTTIWNEAGDSVRLTWHVRYVDRDHCEVEFIQTLPRDSVATVEMKTFVRKANKQIHKMEKSIQKENKKKAKS